MHADPLTIPSRDVRTFLDDVVREYSSATAVPIGAQLLREEPLFAREVWPTLLLTWIFCLHPRSAKTWRRTPA